MREQIQRFMQECPSAKQQAFANNPFGIFVRTDIPEAFYDTGLVDREKYLITASVGAGNWAMVPWICIFDRSITTSATKGVYIVYLLSKDSKRLYLTFNQGCTEISSTHSKRETIQIMREKANEVVGFTDAHGFTPGDEIDLGENLTSLGQFYERGTIYHKVYHVDRVPSEEELRQDLKDMMDIYRQYVDAIDNHHQYGSSARDDLPNTMGDETEMKISEKVNQIKNYIAGKGFAYPDGLIENFYLSLKSKPFVILAGTSGTGKTRLVRLFAEAIGANPQNGQYKEVAVRPDWSDSTDLFGHVDLNGTFVPGAIIEFLAEAQRNPDHPYILCLDEMNLARVEYYLSDFLSVIESRDFVGEHIQSYPLVKPEQYGNDSSAKDRYGEICFPENLYVVGTVNMDETTFPFSRKVLDRANTIEFNYVDLSQPFLGTVQATPLSEKNAFLKTEILKLVECPDADTEYVEDLCGQLEKINRILQKANAHVGYRVRDEICFYMLNNHKAELLNEEDALDNEIMQKILPRIQGSGVSVKEMLCELFKKVLAKNDYDSAEGDAAGMEKLLQGSREIPFPRSAAKVMFMVRRFEEDGFTSYWL